MQNITTKKDIGSSLQHDLIVHHYMEYSGAPARVTLNNGKKVTFIHIPKTAGMSVLKWMYEIPELQNYDKLVSHYRFEKAKKYLGGDLGTTFTIVRNPWEQYVSYWFYDIKRNPEKRDMTFTSWALDRIQRKPLWNQKSYYDGCDIILRYENLIEDFEQIQNLCDCNAPLEKINFLGSRKHYSQFYEGREDIVKEISKLQNDLIEDFGYEFEPFYHGM